MTLLTSIQLVYRCYTDVNRDLAYAFAEAIDVGTFYRLLSDSLHYRDYISRTRLQMCRRCCRHIIKLNVVISHGSVGKLPVSIGTAFLDHTYLSLRLMIPAPAHLRRVAYDDVMSCNGEYFTPYSNSAQTLDEWTCRR
jgi:hypothetical protein